MTYFPDVNVWVALVVDEHSNASLARHWAHEASGDSMVMTRVTQMSVLRLLTNPHVLGRDARSGAEAWRIIDGILARSNIRFAREPEGIEETWRALTSGRVSANLWTDAYLAAFALENNATWLSADRGFARFHRLRWTHPLDL